jgi:hypothetical protein
VVATNYGDLPSVSTRTSRLFLLAILVGLEEIHVSKETPPRALTSVWSQNISNVVHAHAMDVSLHVLGEFLNTVLLIRASETHADVDQAAQLLEKRNYLDTSPPCAAKMAEGPCVLVDECRSFVPEHYI